jgi:hypothetical protein
MEPQREQLTRRMPAAEACRERVEGRECADKKMAACAKPNRERRRVMGSGGGDGGVEGLR